MPSQTAPSQPGRKLNLTLDVDLPGEAETVTVVVSLEATTLEEFADAIKAVGPEPLERLSKGLWDDTAARGLLWAKLRQQVDVAFDDVDFDFGDLRRFLVDRDPEVEESIPMEVDE